MGALVPAFLFFHVGDVLIMRSPFRFIIFAIRRPKAALFAVALTLAFFAVFLLYFGFQYVIGDFNKVDLNFPTYDLGSVKQCSRVSGYTTNAWGHFSVRTSDSGYLSYYFIPQFDNDADPKSIKKMIVMRVDSEDVKAWNALSNYTQRRFVHTFSSPPEPMHIDGYAHAMPFELKEQAIAQLEKNGYSNAEANTVLVPYTISNDASTRNSLLSSGAACALAAIVCFVIWIGKGANFRD